MPRETIAELFQRCGNGDRRALSRLLTLASAGAAAAELRALDIDNSAAAARVVAFTGGGGVGKSSLLGKLISHLRGLGKSVAVLACDPASPLSGGALLGDRVRMSPGDDKGVFIRSLAAAAGSQALADNLDLMAGLLARFGFDNVLLETVGAGQGDTAVREVADVVVLLLQPQAGDELQWEKAGLLEVADIVVVHKADLAGAEQVASQVRQMLSLSPHRAETRVLTASAGRGEGIAELWEAVLSKCGVPDGVSP